MEPKFRISNIVPDMPSGVVTAFYVWDSGHVDSFKVPIQSATLEGLMAIGWERQAWLDEREAELERLRQAAIEATVIEVSE